MIARSTVVDDLAFGGQPRQHVLREELLPSATFPQVEGAIVARTDRRRARQRDLGLLEQQPADQQVADGEQEAHRLQPDLVQLARRSRWEPSGNRSGGDHRLHVVERGAQQRSPSASSGARVVAVEEGLRSGRRRAPAPRRGRARSCGRRSPAPGSRWCPRRASRSWRRGCTARSGSPAGSPSHRASAATRSGTGRPARSRRP